MPGASLDARTRRWRTKRGYLFNHQALAKVFRGKLLAALKQAGLVLPAQLPTKWVVDCKSVGNGDKALIYLVGPAEFTQSLRQTQNSAGLNRIVNDGCQFSIGIENRR